MLLPLLSLLLSLSLSPSSVLSLSPSVRSPLPPLVHPSNHPRQSPRLSTSSHTLYARIYSPSSPLPNWERRGTVFVDSHSDTAWFERSLATQFVGEGVAYQLGLGGKGNEEEQPKCVIVVDAVRFSQQ